MATRLALPDAAECAARVEPETGRDGLDFIVADRLERVRGIVTWRAAGTVDGGDAGQRS